MLPILIYDAVILFTNSARNVITSMNFFKQPSNRCELGRNYIDPWITGLNIVKEMKIVSNIFLCILK